MQCLYHLILSAHKIRISAVDLLQYKMISKVLQYGIILIYCLYYSAWGSQENLLWYWLPYKKKMVYTLTKLFPLKSIWNFYSGNGDCLRWQKKAIIQWTSPVGSTRRINWYRKGSTLLVCSTLRSATNPLREGLYTWSPIFQHFHQC